MGRGSMRGGGMWVARLRKSKDSGNKLAAIACTKRCFYCHPKKRVNIHMISASNGDWIRETSPPARLPDNSSGKVSWQKAGRQQ